MLCEQKKLLKKSPLVGVEPTTFELEVQRASPLRHRGRLDFHRLPGPVFDPPRRETAGRVTR